MTEQTQVIGVIGAGTCNDDVAERARTVGKELAGRGYAIACGGLGGVMEAACRGACEAGGVTIGILPGNNTADANPYVSIPIATGMGIARNVIIVRSSRAVIAIDGGPGTLSEIAHCLQLGVPVVSLGSFDVSPDIHQVDTAEQAVELAIRLAASR